MVLKLLRRIALSLVWFSSMAYTGQAIAEAPKAMNKTALMSKAAAMSTMLSVAEAGSNVVVVGERGMILVSDSENSGWKQAKVPTSVNLTTVKFINDKTGWAVGHMGIVLKTVDGGLTWTKQLDGLQAADIAVEALKDSTDKRAKRQVKYLKEDGPDKPFFDIHINEKGVGFVVGAFNLMFRTADAGETWEYWSHKVENRYSAHLYSIQTIEGGYLLAGEQGVILKSIDNGNTFIEQETPYDGSWFGLHKGNNDELILYGLRGTVYRSLDNGDTWERSEQAIPVSISDATNIGDNIVLSNQAGHLLISKDGGKTFGIFKNIPGTPISSLHHTNLGNIVIASLRGVQTISVN